MFSSLQTDIYTSGMTSATADGASVNFGRWGGFLAKLTVEGSPWLIQLHCVNHRAELAAKSVLEPAFKEIDSLYKSIRILLNKSGRIKSDLQTTCNTLNITHYVLPKIYGTRFLHQRRAGFKRFIHMWVPY